MGELENKEIKKMRDKEKMAVERKVSTEMAKVYGRRKKGQKEI
jgi:hypothetical protein